MGAHVVNIMAVLIIFPIILHGYGESCRRDDTRERDDN